MNLIELNRSLRQLRLGGMAAVLETRLRQAQAEPMVPIDFLSCLVCDELTRRGDRLLERRRKQAQFRDPQVTLDNFDFDFNKKMNRSLVFDLTTATFVARHEALQSCANLCLWRFLVVAISRGQPCSVGRPPRFDFALEVKGELFPEEHIFRFDRSS
jgi:hypothetical protein